VRQISMDFMDVSNLVSAADRIWLSTHISADGDGLGSEMAFYHALKSKGLNPQLVHNDSVPKRYSFLIENIQIQNSHEMMSNQFNSNDICFVFDTHDPKLCEPLFTKLREAKVKIIFIDHHISNKDQFENCLYIIDENASCTGELTYQIIQKLNVGLNTLMAEALYTSLIFDTQNYRTMRDPIKILSMAQIFVEHGARHKEIYTHLFDNWSVDKFNYLAKLITKVSYKNNDTAIITISKSDLIEYKLSGDDVSDLVDLFMGLKNLKISIVLREEDHQSYKLSFRSRKNEILSWAREFGGGGHLYSAGAWVTDSESNIINKLNTLIKNHG
jgi:bifunctional oligoribonuclease and PAP phosphatase NrnA